MTKDFLLPSPHKARRHIKITFSNNMYSSHIILAGDKQLHEAPHISTVRYLCERYETTNSRIGMRQGMKPVSETTGLHRKAEPIAYTSHIVPVKVVHRRITSSAEPSRKKSRSSLVEFDRRPSAPSTDRAQIQRSLSPQARRPWISTHAPRPRSNSHYAAPGSTRQLAIFCEQEKSRFFISKSYAASAKYTSSESNTLSPQCWLALSMWLAALLSRLWAALTLCSFKRKKERFLQDSQQESFERTRNIHTINRAANIKVLAERLQRMDALAAFIDEKIRHSESTASRIE